MITKKLWNSFTDSTRSQILHLLGYHCTSIYTGLYLPYHHDFDFDAVGKELRKVLEVCYLDKTGGVKVIVFLKPSYAPKVSVQPKVKKSSIAEKKSKRYICYYEERVNGELVDDFKEWCEAYSEDEAREYFEDNYSHNPNVQISMIVEE